LDIAPVARLDIAPVIRLDIAPPVIHRTTRGLDNFSMDDDSDSHKEEPFNQPILWGPEDEVYHDDALVYTVSGPPYLQVNHLFDLFVCPSIENGAG
jgi:hypothetical protein